MKLETLGVTTLARIDKVLDLVRFHQKDKADEDVEITMEYLVGSLFPELFQNFQYNMNEEYHRGFKDGYNCGVESGWDDFISALKTLDIVLHDNEGNFRDTYEVLNEISDKWKEVEDKE